MERASDLQFTTVADTDDYAGGRRAVQQLFASKFRPTAILCVNDFMAVGVLRQLRDMGIDVPGDISVTGFDNITLSAVVYPALTTLHIPRDQIGRQILAKAAFENAAGDHLRSGARCARIHWPRPQRFLTRMHAVIALFCATRAALTSG